MQPAMPAADLLAQLMSPPPHSTQAAIPFVPTFSPTPQQHQPAGHTLPQPMQPPCATAAFAQPFSPTQQQHQPMGHAVPQPMQAPFATSAFTQPPSFHTFNTPHYNTAMPGFQPPHHVLLLKLQETTVAVFLLLPQLSPAFLLLLLALRALRCLTSAFFRSFFLSVPPFSRAFAPCSLRFSASVSLWLLLFALIMSCPWLIVMTSLSGATRNWHLFAFAAAFSCLLALAPGPSRPQVYGA